MRNLDYGVEEPTARTNYIGSQVDKSETNAVCNQMPHNKCLQENKSGLPTQLIPVAFLRKSPFLYFGPRDR